MVVIKIGRQRLMNKVNSLLFLILTVLSPLTANAVLINFDLEPSGTFGPGAAVFGSASSQWNYFSRFDNPNSSPIALADDTGAAQSRLESSAKEAGDGTHGGFEPLQEGAHETGADVVAAG